MNRREFLGTAALAMAGLRTAGALPFGRHYVDGWRFYQIDTEIEVLRPTGFTQIWAPRPLLRSTQYQRIGMVYWRCHTGPSRCVEDPAESLGIIHAQFPAGARPYVKVTAQVACRDWSVDLSADRIKHETDNHELQYFRRPDIPRDSAPMVLDTAAHITRSSHTDVEKARAIYDWIVDRTWRDPHVRGCGRGDARFMLESGDLGGKCADLNGLFVALARAAGLPARTAYGLRIAPSRLGFPTLGVETSDVTTAQHCRAEVFLHDYGWVPVDPADVHTVMLEAASQGQTASNLKVQAARSRFFGSWEMNWFAYNFAQNVSLPGSKGAPLPFMMYPQAETGGQRVDCLDPKNFRYTITARPIAL